MPIGKIITKKSFFDLSEDDIYQILKNHESDFLSKDDYISSCIAESNCSNFRMTEIDILQKDIAGSDANVLIKLFFKGEPNAPEFFECKFNVLMELEVHLLNRKWRLSNYEVIKTTNII